MNNIIRIIILSLSLLSCCVLFFLNDVKSRRNNKKYYNILTFINNKKNYINRDHIELCNKEEYYKNIDFFKMKNKGTDPGVYSYNIEFHPIDNKLESYIAHPLNERKEIKLKPMIDKLWQLALDGARAMQIRDDNIKINESKSEFSSTFEVLYNTISNKYMQSPSEALDRHKIASIFMVSIIKSNMLEEKKKSNLIFLGNYILATDCGLLYMMFELNKRLLEKNKEVLNKYVFPSAMSCETDYYRIFYRNLFYSDNNSEWKLNPLDIAERLFLLEYITLEKNGINQNVLREFEKKASSN